MNSDDLCSQSPTLLLESSYLSNYVLKLHQGSMYCEKACSAVSSNGFGPAIVILDVRERNGLCRKLLGSQDSATLKLRSSRLEPEFILVIGYSFIKYDLEAEVLGLEIDGAVDSLYVCKLE
jgi:hypothetical protein